MLSLSLRYQDLSVHKSSTLSLAPFAKISAVSALLSQGKQLLDELGVWGSELFFSHALDRLAVMLEQGKVSMPDGVQLTPKDLEPCLEATNSYITKLPVRGSIGISKKVEAMLGLVLNPIPDLSFRGVVVTSSPLLAIYLRHVLGCFLADRGIFAEVAANRPCDYTGPLASIEDALANYYDGNCQILITNNESLHLLSTEDPSQIVFYDTVPPVLTYLNLKLSWYLSKIVFLPSDDLISDRIQDIERVHGKALTFFKVYSTGAPKDTVESV